jgi:hypothetical protein
MSDQVIATEQKYETPDWVVKEGAIGRRFPVEFLDNLSFKASLTAHVWLKENNLPEQLISIVDQLYVLGQRVGDIKSGELDDFGAYQIIDLVPEMIENILAIGGTFYDENEDLKPDMPTGWQKQAISGQEKP